MLVVRRWTRNGKDRLHVETDTGEKVGFFDWLTPEATVERTDLAWLATSPSVPIGRPKR